MELAAEDEGHGEAVVAFAAHGLKGCGGETWIGGQLFKEGACALNAWVGAGWVDDFAVADDVVADDQGAWASELEGECEVMRVVGLVGVDEDEVEGVGLLGDKLGERIESGPDANLNGFGQACAVDVGLCYGGVAGVELQGNQVSVGRQGAGQPDGAVAAEGADLEDAACAFELREKLEELALVGCDVDGREAGCCVGGERGVENGVVGEQGCGEVLVDGGPEVLRHGHLLRIQRWKRRVSKMAMRGPKKIMMK